MPAKYKWITLIRSTVLKRQQCTNLRLPRVGHRVSRVNAKFLQTLLCRAIAETLFAVKQDRHMGCGWAEHTKKLRVTVFFSFIKREQKIRVEDTTLRRIQKRSAPKLPLSVNEIRKAAGEVKEWNGIAPCQSARLSLTARELSTTTISMNNQRQTLLTHFHHADTIIIALPTHFDAFVIYGEPLYEPIFLFTFLWNTNKLIVDDIARFMCLFWEMMLPYLESVISVIFLQVFQFMNE